MSSTQVNEATGLHPTARPAEKRSDIQFGEKDAGLRKDVHDLGAMMGELLKEQGGEALFDTVERARRQQVRAPAPNRLCTQVVVGVDLVLAVDLVRALELSGSVVGRRAGREQKQDCDDRR